MPDSAHPLPAAGLRLAIVHRPSSFSDRWIEWCRSNGVEHSIIDGYASDVMERLRGHDALLWHFDHEDATDLLMARHVLAAARDAGLVTFPDLATSWHFDDKIAQKYLLEALGAPLVPSWVFYDRQKAIDWLRTAELPVVAKLRAGAGSANVRLLRGLPEAERYCKLMFGAGIRPVSGYFTDSMTRLRSVGSRAQLMGKLKRLPGALNRRLQLQRRAPRERGYVLFQQFVPGNLFDTRVAVVGQRAWAFIRHVRKNDFRASGSRSIDFDPARVDVECVRIAFATAFALGSQSMAFDFVTTPSGQPQLVEISYGYNPDVVYEVPGQWRPDLSWEAGRRRAEDEIMDGVLQECLARCGRVTASPCS